MMSSNTDVVTLDSRNHLRAFTSRLENMGFDYVPVYISQEDYDAIVSSPIERGP